MHIKSNSAINDDETFGYSDPLVTDGSWTMYHSRGFFPFIFYVK